ncbi:hypothetical protein U91I_00432 [alpha proteobacterium U9-1i]|nr:hypothetical protein U91I_00432 [alpha proteobacterium U9-1i]
MAGLRIGRLAQSLVRLRLANAWAQEDWPTSRLHRTYVSGLERKIRNPTILIVERLAKTFKVGPGSLLD